MSKDFFDSLRRSERVWNSESDHHTDRSRPVQGDHGCPDRPSFWDHCNAWLKQPYADDRPPLFHSFAPGTTMDEILGQTRLLVFIGAVDSPRLDRALEEPDAVILLFEPDRAVLENFINTIGRERLEQADIHCFGGAPDRLHVPLADLIPAHALNAGFPAFFTDAFEGEHREYAEWIITQLEVIHYRHNIYPLEIPERNRGYPRRDIADLYSFDQYNHHCENLHPKTRFGTVDQITGTFKGKTAVLVAAGPALDSQMDWLRSLGDDVLLIAVNNALRVLLKNSLEPHFTIISDNSAEAGLAFKDLPRLTRSNLVAHALSHIGNDIFPWVYFYHNDWTTLFPRRTDLPFHGSVITTAFSLAEHLGCTQAVLVGAQLSSSNDRWLDYSKATIHENNFFPTKKTPKRNRMYPATALDGSRVFTSPNFYDAALWFIDRIRMADLKVVNTVGASILQSPDIDFDPQPVIEPDPEITAIFEALPRTAAAPDVDTVRTYATTQAARWTRRGRETDDLLKRLDESGADTLAAVEAFVSDCDRDNATTMLHRFDGFKNRHFHHRFFDSADPGVRISGAQHYLTHMSAMCAFLQKHLRTQLEKLT